MSRISLFLVLTLLVELSFSQQVLSGSLSRFQSATDGTPKIQQVSVDDVWSDVKIDLPWLVAGINSKSCSISQKTYIACALAVQSFASVLNKNYEVIPVSQLNGLTPFYQAQTLALVEMPAPVMTTPKDAYSFFEKMRAQLASRFFTSSAVYVKTPNVDFEMMLLKVYTEAGKNIKPSVYVAAAGKYFEVAMDPHTSLRPTKEMEMASHESGDSFVGIGVELVKLAQAMMVRRVMKNSGAAQAGVLAGDNIIAVDGTSIANLKDDEAVNMMRGLENTKVTLTIQRGQQNLDLTIVRAKTVNPVLSSESITFNGKKMVYLRLTNFMYEGICSEFEKTIQNWESQDVEGYVLDLRNNPGGNVTIAACVGGVFLGDKKTLVYFEKRQERGSTYQALPTKTNIVTSKPLSVLINAYSASASEIIAGAFKDYGRGYIVGLTTFGKGSYQGCIPLSGPAKLTACQTQGLFFLPSGITNQTTGVSPHIEAYLKKDAEESEKYAIREAQMYLYPLEPKVMPTAAAGNWNRLMPPTQCLAKLNLPETFDEATGTTAYYKDYQLLNGLAAVNCAGAL